MVDASSASERVKAPAIALLIVGILGVLSSVLTILQGLLGLGIGAAQLEELRKQGQEIPPWVSSMLTGGGALQIVVNLIGIGGAVFVGFAALRMQKLQSLTLCQVASVIAMIPCLSPCCCFGIPVGIWALIVMNKPDVKSAFTN